MDVPDQDTPVFTHVSLNIFHGSWKTPKMDVSATTESKSGPSQSSPVDDLHGHCWNGLLYTDLFVIYALLVKLFISKNGLFPI